MNGGYGAGPAAIGADEIDELLFQLTLRLAVVEERRVTFSALRDGALVARAGEGDLRFPIGSDLVAFRAEGIGTRAGDLVLAAGDELRVYTVGERALAVVQEVDARGASFEREHRLSSRTRFRSDAEISATEVSMVGFGASYTVLRHGSKPGPVRLGVPGRAAARGSGGG